MLLISVDVPIFAALNSIRMIKLFGWEQRTNERIGEKREEELEETRKRQLLKLFNSVIKFVVYPRIHFRRLTLFFSFTLPLITMLVTYTIYVSVITKRGFSVTELQLS